MDQIVVGGRPLDDAIDTQVSEKLKGIYCCLERHLIVPTLVLLYSAIDSMAWLNMPEGQAEVKGTDFRYWVDHYMVNPEQHVLKQVRIKEGTKLEIPKLSCSSDDLYSARCGIVHSWTAESKLVINGKTKRILYFAGEPDAETALQQIRPEFRTDLIMLHVETLVEVFRHATLFFRNDMRVDRALQRRVEERACHFIFGPDI